MFGLAHLYVAKEWNVCHYNDVTMSPMTSQITSIWTVCSGVCSCAHQGGESTSDRLIPRTKGQWHGKCSIWWRHHDCELSMEHVEATVLSGWPLVHYWEYSTTPVSYLRVKSLQLIWRTSFFTLHVYMNVLIWQKYQIKDDPVMATRRHVLLLWPAVSGAALSISGDRSPWWST